MVETSVIVPIEMGHDSERYQLVKPWRTLALSRMVQFSDIDGPVSGKDGKRKR
jgi:hypothetical protein